MEGLFNDADIYRILHTSYWFIWSGGTGQVDPKLKGNRFVAY